MREGATCVGAAVCAVTACAVSAVAGLALVAVDHGRAELLVLVNAGLLIVITALSVVGFRMFRDVREQQRRILRHMEIQTSVLHNAANAARAAAEPGDDLF
ncbi:hypothetical protein AGRA3207_001396 [Actinomadura graeca]|uniref:Histidine kinase n=1 Tax=Actinomadura graeca TaxID=2750812 RepID=A0ABX8QPC0_9ACTN|nr:hypothetical protein [Actinomadura graeca]QXJ20646.1 hypothetical protein AGRA3207_001396 [Actinomadura graeca]